MAHVNEQCCKVTGWYPLFSSSNSEAADPHDQVVQHETIDHLQFRQQGGLEMKVTSHAMVDEVLPSNTNVCTRATFMLHSKHTKDISSACDSVLELETFP